MLIPFYRNGRWGFIDWRRETVIHPVYDEIGVFSEGLAPVRMADKWGYIDETGNLVIDLLFDEAREFISGQASVRYCDRSYCINQRGIPLHTGICFNAINSCWRQFLTCVSFVE